MISFCVVIICCDTISVTTYWWRDDVIVNSVFDRILMPYDIVVIGW